MKLSAGFLCVLLTIGASRLAVGLDFTGLTGSGAAIPNVQPSLAMTYAVRTSSSSYFSLGEIGLFAENFLPGGWTVADGRTLVASSVPGAVWPLAVSDYSLSSSASASAGAPLVGVTRGAVTYLPWRNLGSIAASGDTTLRLHVDGGAPTGENQASFAAFENGTVPAPQLVVTYTIP